MNYQQIWGFEARFSFIVQEEYGTLCTRLQQGMTNDHTQCSLDTGAYGGS